MCYNVVLDFIMKKAPFMFNCFDNVELLAIGFCICVVQDGPILAHAFFLSTFVPVKKQQELSFFFFKPKTPQHQLVVLIVC